MYIKLDLERGFDTVDLSLLKDLVIEHRQDFLEASQFDLSDTEYKLALEWIDIVMKLVYVNETEESTIGDTVLKETLFRWD